MTAMKRTLSNLTFLQQNKKIRWLVFGLAFFIVVLLVLPLIISSQIKSYFKQNTAAQAEIKNIDFNPFTLQFLLQGLSVKQAAVTVLTVDKLSADIAWQDLFSRQLHIENLQLEGVSVYAEQLPNVGYKIAGIALSSSSTEQSDKKQSAPWGIAVDQAGFKDLSLKAKRSQTLTDLIINQAEIADLDSLKPEKPVRLDLQGTINQSMIKMHGVALAFSDTPEFNGKLLLEPLKLDHYLAELDAALKDNKATVSTNSELQIKLLPDNQLKLYQKGKLKLEAFSWRVTDTEIKLSDVSWQGDVSLEQGVKQALQVSMQGGLGLNQLKLNLPTQQLAVDSGQLNWNGNVSSLIKSGAVKVNADGQLSNRALAIDQGKNLSVTHDALAWQGVIGADLADKAIKLDLKGKLQDENLKLLDTEKDLLVNFGNVIWQGGVNVQQSSESLDINTEADVKVSRLAAQRISPQKLLASMESFQLDKLQFKEGQVLTIESILSSQLLVGEAEPSDQKQTQQANLLKLDKLELKDFHHSPAAGVDIASINHQGINAHLKRDKQGNWNFQQFMEQLPLNTAAKENQADDKSSLSLAIKRIAVEKDSKIVFIDQTQEPEFNQQLNIENLLLEAIDTNKQQASPVVFKGGMGKAKMDVAGSVQLFAKQPVVSLSGKVNNLSLLPFSNLSEKSIGYSLDSGNLTADFKVEIDKGNLDSETQVVLHQLDVKPLTEERQKQLAVKINSGIETGLSMLKDKNDTIKFKLPVKGPLDKVQVDPGDIINQALGTALKKGAKTYFAAALFPFGTLLVIADAATDGMSVKLDPVVFKPGNKDLDEKMQEYLGKVARILEEKPKIYVKVCGVSALEDKTFFAEQQRKSFLTAQNKQKESANKEQPEFKLDEQLLSKQLDEMARQRADVVNDFLTKKLSVDEGRLVECQPRVDVNDKKVKPGADLLL